MQCGIGHCGHCQLGPTLVCRDGPVYAWSELAPLARDPGAVMAPPKQTLAVWKFASCDGCQLSLLDCEDELLTLAEQRRDRLLPRGHAARPSRARTTCRSSRARSRRRTTRSASARSARQSRALVTIGACATAGGIQALRNFADVDAFTAIVYASPDYICTLATSTPISAHVPVDFELNGCPIDKRQLLEVINAAPQPPPPARARPQRLRRVQAPRDRLRHGRPRHALPRSGHPRRAAARCAPPTTAAATGASARWRRRTRDRSATA